MVSGKELTTGTRSQVMLLKELSFSQRNIAERLKVSRGAVQRCLTRSQEPMGTEYCSKSEAGDRKLLQCGLSVRSPASLL